MKAGNTWMWTQHYEEAFCKLKEEISSPRVLAHYDVIAPTKISADASAYGVGQFSFNAKTTAIGNQWHSPHEALIQQRFDIHKSKKKLSVLFGPVRNSQSTY